jgi:hypothetical protein
VSEPLRKRIFREPGQALESEPAVSTGVLVQTELPELKIMIDGFCTNNVDDYAYFTPTHARKQSCDLDASKELAALDFLRRKQRYVRPATSIRCFTTCWHRFSVSIYSITKMPKAGCYSEQRVARAIGVSRVTVASGRPWKNNKPVLYQYC